ncbi:hypothetical protein GTL21_001292 [Salmonella enterica]|nr:hypothetical protein [Salmonella enterica]
MTLISLLKREGPCLSSTLADLLIQSKNISAENARKVISRAVLAGEINSIKNVFPKREQFVYIRDSYGSDEFWQVLTDKLIESGSALGLALSALLARGGIIPKRDFGAASGSPVAMKKKISFTVVWQRLVKIGLCTEIILPEIGECIALREKDERRYYSVSRQIHARLVTESIFIATMVQWSQNLNLISYNLARTRLDEEGKPPAISNYLFDLTGPSYLSPLVTPGSDVNKPGFFACDVLLGTKVTLTQVQPFIAKCKSLRSIRNVGKSLFMLAASQFDKDAFHALKKEGVIPATPENLFGEEFAKSLRELNDFLFYYFTNASSNLEKIDSIMVALTNVKGAAAQLQGALFEYLVAEVMKHEGAVEIGKVFRSADGKKAESDVFIAKGYQEVRFIECKGYKPYSFVKHEDVKHWIGDQVPVFYDAAKKEKPEADIHVEFWTTGKLGLDSQLSLEKFRDNNSVRKRYKIHVLEAHDVKKRFHATRNKNLINVYEKHFAEPFYKEKKLDDLRESYRLAGGPQSYFEDEEK